jgi:hypothetical protein
MEKCNMSRKKPTIEDFINRPKTDKEWDEFERVPEEIVKPKFLTESERMMKNWGGNKFLTTLLILLKFLKPFIFLGTSFLVFFFTLNIIDYFFGNIEDITLLFLFLPLFFGTLTIIILLYYWIYDWIEDSF